MCSNLRDRVGHTVHDPRFLLLGRMNADPVPAAAAAGPQCALQWARQTGKGRLGQSIPTGQEGRAS